MNELKGKKIWLVFLGIAILATGAIFVAAQGDGRGDGGGHGGRGGHGFGPKGGFPLARMIDRAAKELGLSEEQTAQSKKILEESKNTIEPLVKSMRAAREEVKNLGVDGNFDEAKVNQIAENQAATMKQIFIEKEKTKAQLFAILTPEQREKAKGMLEKFGKGGKGMKGRGGHRGGPERNEEAPSQE